MDKHVPNHEPLAVAYRQLQLKLKEAQEKTLERAECVIALTGELAAARARGDRFAKALRTVWRWVCQTEVSSRMRFASIKVVLTPFIDEMNAPSEKEVE